MPHIQTPITTGVHLRYYTKTLSFISILAFRLSYPLDSICRFISNIPCIWLFRNSTYKCLS